MIDGESACIRVREGGEVLDRVPLPLSGFACALGGEDGMTLSGSRTGDGGVVRGQPDPAHHGRGTGQVLTARPVPHAGRP